MEVSIGYLFSKIKMTFYKLFFAHLYDGEINNKHKHTFQNKCLEADVKR